MCRSTPKVALISRNMAVMGVKEPLLAVSSFLVTKVYGDFTWSDRLLGHGLIFYCLFVLKRKKPACEQWQLNNDDWLTGPHEVHLGRGERLLVLVVPLFIIAAASHRASVAPLLRFISCTPLSLPPLRKSSPSLQQWMKTGELEDWVSWNLTCANPPTHHGEKEKAKAGLFLPQYQPLCLFSPTENTPWFSYCGGAERERGG